MIDPHATLTACFSFSSRSFFNRSLISLSLTTHAAALLAASSGLDLFFKRSGDIVSKRSRTRARSRGLTSLQGGDAELLFWDCIRKLLG